jgi:hypothetical protein
LGVCCADLGVCSADLGVFGAFVVNYSTAKLKLDEC